MTKTLLGLSLSLAVLATPIGTVRAASTPPAQQVLGRMKVAVAAKNSMHLDMQIQMTTQQTIHLVIHISADASSHPFRIIERVSTQALAANIPSKNAATQRAQIMVSGSRAALKQGNTRWRCDTVTHLLGSYFDITHTLSPQVSHPANLGPVTVDGISTWHIRGATRLTLLGLTNSMPTDLYVSRVDYTLVRETASLKLQQQGVAIQEQLITRVSHYGETVKATLPASCKG